MSTTRRLRTVRVRSYVRLRKGKRELVCRHVRSAPRR